MSVTTEKPAIEYAAFLCEKIIQLVPDLIAQPCTILDFGCGDGLLTHFVQNAFFNAKVCGVDAAAIIEKTKREFLEIDFFCLQEKKLPFADSKFDVIYAADVFHHIPRTEHALYVKELMRVLKPGGRIIMFEVNPYNIIARYRFKKNPLEKNSALLSAHYAAQLFKNYNCSVVTQYYFLSDYLPVWLKDRIQILPFGSLYCVLVHVL